MVMPRRLYEYQVGDSLEEREAWRERRANWVCLDESHEKPAPPPSEEHNSDREEGQK